MTIQEAIRKVNEIEPNQYESDIKIDWLSRLDSQIWREVIITHEGHDPSETFEGYTEATGPQHELLVKAPDDEGVYINYLKAKIFEANHEMGKYNQAIVFYNDAYMNYKNYYNSTHMPINRAPYFKF